MAIRITMPPDVVDSVSGALIAKQVLGEIVKRAVKTPQDEHYFAVLMHKGVSEHLSHLTFNDIAAALSCPTSTVHHFMAEHMMSGSARGGCKVCNAASEELRQLIVEEKGKDPLSVTITLGSVSGR